MKTIYNSYMYAKSIKIHQKLISLPDPLYTRLVRRAKKVGVSFSEYLRLMTYLHLNSPEPFEFIEGLDEKTSQEIEESLKDYRAGRFHTFGSMAELKKHLNSL